MSPSVAVLGTGGVGGMLAVRLADAGIRVVCVARPETAAAIRAGGLALEQGGDSWHAAPEAVEELADRVDVLVVAVKEPALAEALGRVRPEAVAAGVTVPLLNGLEHVDAVRRRVGERVAVGSIGRLEAHRRDATTIVQGPARPLVTLASRALAAAELGALADLLGRSGAEIRIAADEQAVLWEKLARLAPLAALTAATGTTVGTLRDDPELRALLRAGLEETAAVAAAEGVAVTPARQWEMIEAMPATLTTSTARDVAAGRPSELDAIAGAVVRAGRRAGVPTPTLEDLLDRVAAGAP